MLTQATVKAAKPQGRARKLFDAGGLFLFVAPTGTKSWRLKYRFRGREKLLTIGRYPDLSLKDARSARDHAKARLADGEDPGAAEQSDDFEHVARAWYQLQRASWSTTHAGDVLASLERDVFPLIGARPIGALRGPDLLPVIHAIERRGAIASARRLRQRLSAIFRYAISLDLAELDPAGPLDQAMAAAPLAQPHPALTDIDALRGLFVAVDQSDGASAVRLASHFLALTAVRLDAVRGARWEEFEGLDGSEPVWRVPPARMKLARAKKESARFAHVVPLSAAALAILRAAGNQSLGQAHASDLVFPGRGQDKSIGEGAIGALYRRLGYSGSHVPHGWRSSFSTVMNERRRDDRAAIDLALAHASKDKVEAAYNRSELLDVRRSLFDEWGALIAPQ